MKKPAFPLHHPVFTTQTRYELRWGRRTSAELYVSNGRFQLKLNCVHIDLRTHRTAYTQACVHRDLRTNRPAYTQTCDSTELRKYRSA